MGDDGVLLRGERRRLATLESLGVAGHEQIDADRSAAIVDDCASYFDRRPYRRWFDPLDRLLRVGAGASYFDGSACHLDLVQWATTPVWGRLAESTRTRLLREDEPFLVRQLSREHYRLVIVNGRTVMRWAEAAGLVSWRCVGHLEGPPRVELYLGQGVDPTFVAWSCNVQSQPGATRHAPGLAGFIAEHVGSANAGGPGLNIDRLPKGTRLGSIDGLVDRLRGWLEDSDGTQSARSAPSAGSRG